MIVHGLNCPEISGSTPSTVSGVHYVINKDGWCWMLRFVGQDEPDVLLLTDGDEVTDTMIQTLSELGTTVESHSGVCPGATVMEEVS